MDIAVSEQTPTCKLSVILCTLSRLTCHMEKKTNGEKNEFILYIFILYIFISSFISSVKDMYLVRVF